MVTPYQDGVKQENTWQRTFEAHVPDSELIWHMDKLPRSITVLAGVNWKLQMDNQLPQPLEAGKCYEIPAQVYHRLIKGNDRLLIQIVEKSPTHQE